MEPVRQVWAVSSVLALLAVSFWWLRRKGMARFVPRGPRRQTLQAVERLALGPQHALHLVRVAGRGLLVGTSPAGCAVLESFDWPKPAAPGGVMEAH